MPLAFPRKSSVRTAGMERANFQLVGGRLRFRFAEWGRSFFSM